VEDFDISISIYTQGATLVVESGKNGVGKQAFRKATYFYKKEHGGHWIQQELPEETKSGNLKLSLNK